MTLIFEDMMRESKANSSTSSKHFPLKDGGHLWLHLIGKKKQLLQHVTLQIGPKTNDQKAENLQTFLWKQENLKSKFA